MKNGTRNGILTFLVGLFIALLGWFLPEIFPEGEEWFRMLVLIAGGVIAAVAIFVPQIK